MKRVLALMLAMMMVACSFASCSTLEKEDKGAIITLYFGDEIYDFDPTQSYTNEVVAQLTTLMFEGLTVLDSNGDWKKGMMDKYELLQDDEGNTKLQITLRETKWSDGRTVQANDFVYAWKRILEPSFKNDAACLLYDIKNARDIKMGDKTVDDLKVSAVETYVLEIEFEHEVDIDAFLRTCASPALVPLREDKVGLGESWAKRASSMVTNGPFDIRRINYGSELRLERSAYYYRDSDKNQILDKYVIPYRIQVLFSNGDENRQISKLYPEDKFVAEVAAADSTHYIGDIALASRGEYAESAVVFDALNTYSYFFNTEKELFKDAKVRKALSMALNRQAIAETLVFADAATGLVPAGIADTTTKTDFRANGGAILSTSADIAAAKALLDEAGVRKSTITITCRNDEVDLAVAEAAKTAWEELGFTVKVKETGTELLESKANESAVYSDLYTEAFKSGDFDVIAVDMQALANDAYAMLAPFATKYSGNGVDMMSENYDVIGHITGYANADYDKIIEDVYNAESAEVRSQKLHEAEAKLLEDMPVIPVVFLKNAYVNSGVLSGFETTFWGTTNLKGVKMKDYMEFKKVIEGTEEIVG